MRQTATTVMARLLFLFLANPAVARTIVTLPVEVVGENGAMASATVEIPTGKARQVVAVRMQIHNLAYADMASVQINKSNWVSLNNSTVATDEPGRSYGGIGGGFSTLSVTLQLPSNTVMDGENTVRFRFNSSNGFASGFRVLAFNFLGNDSSPVLDLDSFVQEDPNSWLPPLKGSASMRDGHELWSSAPLKSSDLPNARGIHAHCGDCHARDGRDLKYFNFSNKSIIARSCFHGLSERQGELIASYIRGLQVPNPGRPWNPPYQPGPGLDEQPVVNWAAGAGLQWVLSDDNSTLRFIFGTREMLPRHWDVRSDWKTLIPLINRTVFRPDGDLNPREIPISFQLPDWNHWLPLVHPLDAWGEAFLKSDFFSRYGSRANPSEARALPKTSLPALLASPGLPEMMLSGRIERLFDKWLDARRAFLKPYVGGSINWTTDLSRKTYSTELWQLVKTWEMMQEFRLEGRGRELYGPTGESRTWFTAIPASTAPAAVNIPDGPAGIGGSALTNEYFNAVWYETQILLNSGNHKHRDRYPVDWVYVIGRFLNLFRQTHRAEPARLLMVVIKSMQSTDPHLGPENQAQGWRPFQNVDPTILVSETWAPIFEPLPREAKRAITESMLAAWLEKNQQFPLGRYFTPGQTERSYALPPNFGGVAGGKAWEAAPLFLNAGVTAETVTKLKRWGAAYEDVASRFQYSTRVSTRAKKAESP